MSTQVEPTAAKPRRAGATKPPPERIVIQYPTPAVDDGHYPAKRVVGDTVNDWTSHRTFDPDGLRITFAQDHSSPPVARIGG